ncbi:LADA_0C08570g1_1 [Lachancea dasiensis]|uniref:LADA_0C08570g1_1 n=1 Tax=Lachancea dasiensis TaxID=1072105 RepID=A0A1G4J077_9SACH|nr:LADA_0C08570g1_1 [Lachancea dasiensis]
MDKHQGGSFSTPLRKQQPEYSRKTGSFSLSKNIPQSSQQTFELHAHHNGNQRESFNKENANSEFDCKDQVSNDSRRKRARVGSPEPPANAEMNSSPAVIEMIDRHSQGSDLNPSEESMNEIRDEISASLNGAARDILHSETSVHENGNQTSVLRNLLSPAKRISPEKSQFSPRGSGNPEMSNLDSLTPLKSYFHGSEQGITQALQSRFRRELKKYEHHLRAKDEQTDEYRRQVLTCYEKIKSLGENLDEQRLAFSALWADHEVLKASNSAREPIWERQALELESVSADRTKLEEKISKLKVKLSEVRNEINMLNQNSQILQEKFHIQINDNEALKKQLATRASMEQKLESNLERLKQDKDQLSREKDRLEIEVINCKNIISSSESESRAQADRIARLESQLAERDDVCKELQETINSFEDIKKQSTTDLENRVSGLLANIKQLKGQLAATDALKTTIDESNAKLKTSEMSLAAAHKRIEGLQEQHAEVERYASTLESQLKESASTLETINDQMAIKSAEVEELGHDVEELRQNKAHLEEFVKVRDTAVENWKTKYDSKCVENNKLSIEVESIQFRNGNLESEHLVELEHLHQQMTSLQDTLRSNSEQIKKLEVDNQGLRDAAAKAMSQENKSDLAATHDLEAQVSSLRQHIREKEADASKRLQLLAEDLYIQYSSKHEQKVKMLKKGYEAKYKDKIEKLDLEKTGLQDELDQLNKSLQAEREEKHLLVKRLYK